MSSGLRSALHRCHGQRAPRLALLLLLLLGGPGPGWACFKRLVYHGQFPLLYVDQCVSNYDLGLLVGSTFSSHIRGRMHDSLAFQKVQAYCATNWGRQLLAALKDAHRAAFPAYYFELAGLAAGAELPFDQVFMLNLRQEILAASESPEHTERWLAARRAEGLGPEQAPSDEEEQAAAKAWFAAGGGAEASEGLTGPRLGLAEEAGGEGEQGNTEGSASDYNSSRAASRRELRWLDPASPRVTRPGRTGSGRQLGGARRGAEGSFRAQAQGGGQAQGRGKGAEAGASPGFVDPATTDACSDVAVRLRGPGDEWPRILVGHNEDATNDTLGPGRMYYLRVSQPGRAPWLALTYAGELASTAFGANTAGVAFTLDALYPSEAQLPGLGRNFMSRALLDARGLEAAMEVLTQEGQATGRSVNLMSFKPSLEMWNVEIGPGGSYDAVQLGDNDWLFHANSYLRLPQRQKVENSSIHRQARAAAFDMPVTPGEVLALLGDTEDGEFPIYRTGDYGGLVYTLCTALFDLVGRQMVVFRGNPREGVVGSILALDTLTPKAAGAWKSSGKVLWSEWEARARSGGEGAVGAAGDGEWDLETRRPPRIAEQDGGVSSEGSVGTIGTGISDSDSDGDCSDDDDSACASSGLRPDAGACEADLSSRLCSGDSATEPVRHDAASSVDVADAATTGGAGDDVCAEATAAPLVEPVATPVQPAAAVPAAAVSQPNAALVEPADDAPAAAEAAALPTAQAVTPATSVAAPGDTTPAGEAPNPCKRQQPEPPAAAGGPLGKAPRRAKAGAGASPGAHAIEAAAVVMGAAATLAHSNDALHEALASAGAVLLSPSAVAAGSVGWSYCPGAGPFPVLRPYRHDQMRLPAAVVPLLWPPPVVQSALQQRTVVRLRLRVGPAGAGAGAEGAVQPDEGEGEGEGGEEVDVLGVLRLHQAPTRLVAILRFPGGGRPVPTGAHALATAIAPAGTTPGSASAPAGTASTASASGGSPPALCLVCGGLELPPLRPDERLELSMGAHGLPVLGVRGGHPHALLPLVPRPRERPTFRLGAQRGSGGGRAAREQLGAQEEAEAQGQAGKPQARTPTQGLAAPQQQAQAERGGLAPEQPSQDGGEAGAEGERGLRGPSPVPAPPGPAGPREGVVVAKKTLGSCDAVFSGSKTRLGVGTSRALLHLCGLSSEEVALALAGAAAEARAEAQADAAAGAGAGQQADGGLKQTRRRVPAVRALLGCVEVRARSWPDARYEVELHALQAASARQPSLVLASPSLPGAMAVYSADVGDTLRLWRDDSDPPATATGPATAPALALDASTGQAAGGSGSAGQAAGQAACAGGAEASCKGHAAGDEAAPKGKGPLLARLWYDVVRAEEL
ncbi:hypothetical protein HYH03_009407 [Edaphochlamys debaryana]|uniref:Peptidase C45 hydrolase domain-containing protein n=1 Tax=Edaphochlamys debaryana TaxID=47281 RepID=A0A835XYD6_9CHLO|nr:hypothetical protein HYH03_009407 [Edaphochlamys debaryana]|eukprot:KAG2492466.1 hypothetical protein HYH03_009407 [Edaphochlamys debaryana]